jgi:YidC/Oxa1 family membrane protein insertase
LDKKTLLAIGLILIVFALSNEYIWKVKQQDSIGLESENINTTEIVENNSPQQTQIVDNQVIESDIAIDNEIVLENENLKLYFSNRGGNLQKIILKKYFMSDKETFVNLIPEGKELANLSLHKDDGNIDLNNTIFEYTQNHNDNSIVFYLENSENQVLLSKKYIINDGYSVDFEFNNNGYAAINNYEVGFNSGISDTEDYLIKKPKLKQRDYKVIYQKQNSVDFFRLQKLKEMQKVEEAIDWAAVRSKYFTMACLSAKEVDAYKMSAFRINNSPAFSISVKPANSRTHFNDYFKMYFGPVIDSELQKVDASLDSIVERGKWLGAISKLFLNYVKLIHKVIPNWGVCLIIFALTLKIILYPLTHKSFEATQKMQKIQPQLKELQKKYKGDPRQLQVESQKLYKENGVNPLGGCLPMLLQMPVFFALYPVLRFAIDLRQAAFVFWIQDLSEPDPYLILPILMGVFMFIQQMLMTKNQKVTDDMDETQLAQIKSQKMMGYMMPVMMFFIFKSFPSGLVLYWTVFNVFSIAQQYYIQKKFS